MGDCGSLKAALIQQTSLQSGTPFRQCSDSSEGSPCYTRVLKATRGGQRWRTVEAHLDHVPTASRGEQQQQQKEWFLTIVDPLHCWLLVVGFYLQSVRSHSVFLKTICSVCEALKASQSPVTEIWSSPCEQSRSSGHPCLLRWWCHDTNTCTRGLLRHHSSPLLPALFERKVRLAHFKADCEACAGI